MSSIASWPSANGSTCSIGSTRSRTALLVIDMQNFYVGEIASVVGIIPNINRIARELRARGGLAAFVGMTAGAGGHSLWPIYHDYFFTPEKGANHRDQLSEGHPGHKFHADLDIAPGDVIIYKNRFSPFIAGASNIEEVLRARGIDSLIVTGTATNMCCELAARDAMMRDYKVGDGVGCQRRPLPGGSPRRADVILPEFWRRAHDRRGDQRSAASGARQDRGGVNPSFAKPLAAVPAPAATDRGSDS